MQNEVRAIEARALHPMAESTLNRFGVVESTAFPLGNSVREILAEHLAGMNPYLTVGKVSWLLSNATEQSYKGHLWTVSTILGRLPQK